MNCKESSVLCDDMIFIEFLAYNLEIGRMVFSTHVEARAKMLIFC